MPAQTNACKHWSKKFKIPPKDFNFEKFYKRGLYKEGFVEGVDYVQCKICLKQGKDFRKRIINQHLKKEHEVSKEDYLKKFPGTPTYCKKTLQERENTCQDRYGVTNITYSKKNHEKIKKECFEKHGVHHPSQIPEVKERRKETNLEKYGHENPFGSEKIQAKIKETNLEKYGVENPNQSPEIRKKTRQTKRRRLLLSMLELI